jgi:hypothetical protein
MDPGAGAEPGVLAGAAAVRLLFALALVVLALLLAALLFWVRPIWAETTRGTTDEEKTLGRLQTLCADGTRAVSTYNRTLTRWETTVTPPQSSAQPKIRPRRQENRRCPYAPYGCSDG